MCALAMPASECHSMRMSSLRSCPNINVASPPRARRKIVADLASAVFSPAQAAELQSADEPTSSVVEMPPTVSSQTERCVLLPRSRCERRTLWAPASSVLHMYSSH